MFKNILVPIDGGELSGVAIKGACSFAKETGARLTFYHAKPGYFPGYIAGEMVMADVGMDEAYLASMDKQSEDILRAAAEAAREEGVACETLSSECDAPHEGIIAAAEDKGCDLIFMACHGHLGVSALLLGSETQKVLSHCKVPVLVYR